VVKGQVISGEYGKILIRQKAGEKIELGELLVGDTPDSKILLQAVNLLYGSQISQQNLELISGMKLEDNQTVDFMDARLRNYNLAVLKNLITISGNNAKVCKRLPSFFSSVREITKEDLSFLTKPKNPLFIGNLRSGSKELELPIYLDGEDVFSHHILVPAQTGRGKSLDENEEVLIKTNNKFLIKPIGELVKNNSNFQGSEVITMNPKNYSMDFKKIIKFVKHKAPSFMHNVLTESGREVMVTGDHNLYVLRNGKLTLLRTQDVTNDDYIPLPLKIDLKVKQTELNLFELLKEYPNIYVKYNKRIINKLKSKSKCLRILSKYVKKPLQKYNDFVINQNKIQIILLSELLHSELTYNDLKTVELTDQRYSLILKAIYPISKEFLELVGIYIAEGYCLNDNSFRISCSEKEIQKKLNENIKKIGLNYFWVKKRGKNVDVGVSSSIFTKVLKGIGVGDLSGNKRLPYFFLNLSDENLAILLRAYYDGDGGVDIEKNTKQKKFKISSMTKSKKLASDICIAMYRYGILARCKKRWMRALNTEHKGNWYYRVAISGQQDLSAFLSMIGFGLQRKNSVLKHKLDYKGNTNIDLIPCAPEIIRKIRLSLRLDQTKLSRLCNCSESIISLVELGKRRPSRNLATTLIKIFKKQLSGLDHVLFKKLMVFSDSPSPETLAELINKCRIEQGLTLFELGKKAGIYTSCSKHYIGNDISRILATKEVKNSPKIYRLGKFLLDYSGNKCLSKFADVFELDFNTWSMIVKKTLLALNFPHQAMQREKSKLGYYARQLKKGKSIELESLRQLAKLLAEYYTRMRGTELLVNELEKLLNFRWDKVKEIKKIKYNKRYVYDLTVKDNNTFLAGHGGVFVHNSNMTSVILWDTLDKDYCGILVLDPHDEYYGRNKLGLKDHSSKEKVAYYTPNDAPSGGRTLKINLSLIKPGHFNGVVYWSDPQMQALNQYYREYGIKWIESIALDKPLKAAFHEGTLSVVKRRIMSLLDLEFNGSTLFCNSVFDLNAGETTISDICKELEESKAVIIDTSDFSGSVEILIGSLIVTEVFSKYKRYKIKGSLKDKPVISVVLEEAPRVLGKEALEKGPNIFSTIAREGRKFKVGLFAITQLPSLIPRQILANMNTKIILGIEMGPERDAIIQSSAQDLSDDDRNIASLDKGEAIITSNFARFATPVKIPLFEEFVKKDKKEDVRKDFGGVVG
jgi:intein/homing endonuclease